MFEADFISELESALKEQDDPKGALTVRELSAKLGVGEAAVRRRLHRVAAAGRLEVLSKGSFTLSGVPFRVPAYRILPAL